ncbi:MAG: glutamine-hydrolyzing carbamoyl-phosphate synthase small subunit [Methanomassiliicoccaceae archaeon]|nr:glutamine-hydrolyzing carbamoyl-phosphate synthase small subunit [Methanomassiliicoccaceae archaeon]
MARGYLVLEDGTVYEGSLFGYRSPADGEVVFGTGMSGYQESLTDPSFRGQILVMTYPLAGDYGIVDGYSQSKHVHVRGLVVRENCTEPTDMYGGRTLDSFLKENKVPGISGIDTRDLVIRLRDGGSMRGAITDIDVSPEDTVKKLQKMPFPMTGNLVGEVSCKEISVSNTGKDLTVGVIDCGTKSAIIDDLASRFNVVIFPYDTPADVIIEHRLNGIMITNGPGDPSHRKILDTVVRTEKELASRLPMYGICFGSQTLALALGAETYKMKFGHRGNNQPVKFEDRVYITSQNHGYAVDSNSLDGTGLIADQINVNDGTVEGCRHRDLPIFSTQYHPEAKPGPADTLFLFDRFGKVMKEGRL